jgi:hypothetical protein
MAVTWLSSRRRYVLWRLGFDSSAVDLSNLILDHMSVLVRVYHDIGGG